MPIEVTELSIVSVPLYVPLMMLRKLFGMLGILILKPLKVQPKKALLPIEVTESPMYSVSVKPLQSRKAFCPIVITELGMFRKPVKPEQPLKALSLIVTTVFGKDKPPMNPTQPLNAYLPIEVK